MYIEIFAIVGSIASIISGILTFSEYKRNNKLPSITKIIIYLLFILGLPLLVYFHFVTRQDSKIKDIQSEFIIKDSKISSQVNKKYSHDFSGYLAKLSTIVGFYKRHENLYNEEYNKYNQLYEIYLKKYDDHLNKNGSLYPTDVSEIESVVETGVSNIQEITNQKYDIADFKKSSNKSDTLSEKIIIIIITGIIGFFLKDAYTYLKNKFIDKDVPKIIIKYSFEHRSTYGISPRNYKFVNHYMVHNIDTNPIYDIRVSYIENDSNQLLFEEDLLNVGEKLEKNKEIIIHYGESGNNIEEAKLHLPTSFRNPKIIAEYKNKDGKIFKKTKEF